MQKSPAFLRWFVFSATIFGGALFLYVLWTGDFSVEVVKAVISFGVLAGVALVLHRLARSAGAARDEASE